MVTNEDLEKRLKRIQASTDIQTIILILGFAGILTLTQFLKKGQKIIK